MSTPRVPAPRMAPAPARAMTADEPMEMTPGRRAPFTIVPDWVMLSGISAPAQALYVQAAMHINQKRGDEEVWPTREDLAARLGYKKPATVDPYIKELVELGAFDVYTRRFAGGMRARNRYVVHQDPPPGYTGPRSLADYYARKDARSDETAARPVVRSSGLPTSAPADTGSPSQRTPVDRWGGSPLSAPADGNQTKNNHTKKNKTKTSSSPSLSVAVRDASAPGSEDGQESPAISEGGALDGVWADPSQQEAAVTFLRTLPAPWRLPASVVRQAAPAVAAALAAGWPVKALGEQLTHSPEGIRNYGAVLLHRLPDLPEPPQATVAHSGPACPQHPGARRRGNECGSCWADRQG
ncbi:hypothetical protein ACFV0L_41430 [Streptosporangium canum]|uniref:hypothetical protein n=1 Tax=Streptosporangium canum TaxID=324952 RepID=UPI0036C11920